MADNQQSPPMGAGFSPTVERRDPATTGLPGPSIERASKPANIIGTQASTLNDLNARIYQARCRLTDLCARVLGSNGTPAIEDRPPVDPGDSDAARVGTEIAVYSENLEDLERVISALEQL